MQRISKSHEWIAVMLLAVAAVSTAHAIPIVDTGPASYVSSSHPGLSLFGNGSWGSQFIAGRFTTTEAYEITSLSAFVRGYACCGTITSSLTLGLATGPDAPDNAAFSNLLALPTSFTSVNNSAGWADVAVDNYLLTAGTYWIVASVAPGQYSAGLGMPGGAANPLDAYAAYSSDLGSWHSLGATLGGTNIPATLGFRVEGNAVAASVPEPATMSLMLFGLGGVLLGVRRRSSVAKTGVC